MCQLWCVPCVLLLAINVERVCALCTQYHRPLGGLVLVLLQKQRPTLILSTFPPKKMCGSYAGVSEKPYNLSGIVFMRGFSRFVTRPAGRVRRISMSRGSSRVWLRGVRNLTGWVGSGRVGQGLEAFNCHGSGRIGSGRSGPMRRSPTRKESCFFFASFVFPMRVWCGSFPVPRVKILPCLSDPPQF